MSSLLVFLKLSLGPRPGHSPVSSNGPPPKAKCHPAPMHDVDPFELVVFLLALCRKVGVSYVIVRGKPRLGTVVHNKTAAVVLFGKPLPEE